MIVLFYLIVIWLYTKKKMKWALCKALRTNIFAFAQLILSIKICSKCEIFQIFIQFQNEQQQKKKNFFKCLVLRFYFTNYIKEFTFKIHLEWHQILSFRVIEWAWVCVYFFYDDMRSIAHLMYVKWWETELFMSMMRKSNRSTHLIGFIYIYWHKFDIFKWNCQFDDMVKNSLQHYSDQISI